MTLTAAELVLCVLLKSRLARTICRYWLAALALLFVSSLILSIFWTGNMIAIYLLHALVYCLYMVWQLYRSEFFTFSLVTASAGVVFYLIDVIYDTEILNLRSGYLVAFFDRGFRIRPVRILFFAGRDCRHKGSQQKQGLGFHSFSTLLLRPLPL